MRELIRALWLSVLVHCRPVVPMPLKRWNGYILEVHGLDQNFEPTSFLLLSPDFEGVALSVNRYPLEWNHDFDTMRDIGGDDCA